MVFGDRRPRRSWTEAFTAGIRALCGVAFTVKMTRKFSRISAASVALLFRWKVPEPILMSDRCGVGFAPWVIRLWFGLVTQ